MKKFLLAWACFALIGSVCIAQEDKKFDLPDTEVAAEPSLGTIDEDQLFQRIDDLTGVVNVHTEQIAELDKRLAAIEDRAAPVGWNAAPPRRSALSSTLKATVPVRASGGSTGNVQSRVVSSYVSAPVVRSYEYIEESPPVIYEQAPVYQMPIASPVYVGTSQQPRSANLSYTASYGTATTRRRGLGSRVGNFLRGGNCPDGNCPR